MIQVDTSVLCNDSRGLHVSVKGSSASTCTIVGKGQCIYRNFDKGIQCR